MATEYNVNKYFFGTNAFGTQFCDTIYSATLAANTDTSLAVPATAAIGTPAATEFNKFLAVFSYSYSAVVYVALNAAAAAPAGSSFASTTSSINPAGRVVQAGDVIHFKSTGTPSVTVEFYAIQE